MAHALAKALATLTVLAAPLAARAATSPTWESWKTAEDDKAFKIVQYLDLGQKHAAAVEPHDELVIIGAGRAQGVVVGTIFKAFRPKTPTQSGGGPLWVELGRLKTLEVQDQYAIAAIQSQVTILSKALFPRFPGVMAGDLVVAQKMEITRKQVMTPTVALAYKDIFLDPKGSPSTFELRPEAAAALLTAVKPFVDARLSLLMIEGYTDHNGAASVNQVESYQRALTIRQYLIDELGFDEKRVVAIGYGEAEPSDPSLKPGYEATNRRIVLKAIPVPPAL